MRAMGLGVVIEAGEGCKLKVGDYVCGPWGAFHCRPSIRLHTLLPFTGWTEYAVIKEKALDKLQYVL